jgi:hypothetical protein
LLGNIPDGLVVVPVNTLQDAVDAVEAFAAGDTNLPTCAA